MLFYARRSGSTESDGLFEYGKRYSNDEGGAHPAAL